MKFFPTIVGGGSVFVIRQVEDFTVIGRRGDGRCERVFRCGVPGGGDTHGGMIAEKYG